MAQENTYNQVRNILIVILILNLAVALAKIIYGMITNTSSMIADGYHSIADGASNVVGIIGIWIASRPADENHPYGHHKFETLATIVITLFLFFVSYEILSNAYSRFKNPEVPRIDLFSFGVMLITLAINFGVTRFESKKGKELKSSILVSDAKHTQSDIYVSISVLVSLVAIRMGLVIVDTIVAGIIALLIIKAGFEILIPSIHVLSDAHMIDPNKIYGFVMDIPEVVFCHKIRTRGKENHVMVDLHVGLDKNLTVEESHDISHKIGNSLKNSFDAVEDVIVHIEPTSH